MLSHALNRMADRLAHMRELERQLNRRDRLSALGEVASGIAHEVRNPLSIIKTSAELVQRGGQLNESDFQLLGYVVDEVRRIDALIGEFLAFAKPPPPVLAPLRPISIVEQVSNVCRAELDRHNISLEIEDLAPGTLVSGDDSQLFQAVLNLVVNAIQAMPEGGSLKVQQQVAGAELVIAIRDTGPGIAPDLIERIFDPFLTTKVTGTGLGLAKVFAVMQSHGGRVECRSEPGAGAQFNLYFPLHTDDTDHGRVSSVGG
jgi:signal transduction histidine kinase